MTKDKVKFLDMLQNSKSQKMDQSAMKIPKLHVKTVKKPGKKSKKSSNQKKKKKATYDEDEESNFNEEVAYQSDSQAPAAQANPKDGTPVMYLKSLMLKKEEV